MPTMAFVMAIGMAFANKVNVQSNGWVERNGVATQLSNDPCTSSSSDFCRVIFADDPNGLERQVYLDQGLTMPKAGGAEDAYIISE